MAELCDCITWARIDGRMTNHHPRCHLFKEERFLKVTMEGGGSYTQPLTDLRPLLEEIDDGAYGQKWTLEILVMTPEEYLRLPEFAGH